MTYYGRWTYKFEIAASKGAAGVLLVHEAEPAGYPFSVVQARVLEQFDLVTPDKNMTRAAIEGWITVDKARDLVRLGGQDFDTLKSQASTREFQPVSLGVTASMTITNTLRTIDSKNVVARLDGRDPTLKGEYVIYTAHWDHLGVGAAVDGDTIYNGAKDNAVGRRRHPRHRPRVHQATGAAETLDRLPGGDGRGAGAARLGVLHGRADLSAGPHGGQHQHRRAQRGRPHARPHAGGLRRVRARRLRPRRRWRTGAYRPAGPRAGAGLLLPLGSLQLRQAGGAGASTPTRGSSIIGKPREFGERVRRAWNERDYHQPSDVVRPDWDLTGAREDLKVYFAVGLPRG